MIADNGAGIVPLWFPVWAQPFAVISLAGRYVVNVDPVEAAEEDDGPSKDSDANLDQLSSLANDQGLFEVKSSSE